MKKLIILVGMILGIIQILNALNPVPLRPGIVQEIDKTNLVLTVDTSSEYYQIKITPDTRIKRNGQYATSRDPRVGDSISGFGVKTSDNFWVATRLFLHGEQ